MHSLEPDYVPGPLQDLSDRAEANRSKLTSWIFDVSTRYNFKSETGFLAVNITDRILGLRTVGMNDLAILGVTSLFMAAKYEEVKVPFVEDFANLVSTNYKVSREAILQM